MTTALRQYLEAGGRPEDVPGFGIIVDELVDRELGGGRGIRDGMGTEDWIAQSRRDATEPMPHPNWESTERWQTFSTYLADYLADAETRRVFWQSLDEATRLELADRIEATRRPVVMEAGPQPWRSWCYVCGAPQGPDEDRIVLQPRDAERSHRVIDDMVTLCLGCVTTAILSTGGQRSLN